MEFEKKKVEITVTLTLNQEESEWLKRIAQSSAQRNEFPGDRERGKALWNLFNDAGINQEKTTLER